MLASIAVSLNGITIPMTILLLLHVSCNADCLFPVTSMLTALLLDADYSDIYRVFDVLFFLFLAAIAAGLIRLTVKAVHWAKAKLARGERWGVGFLVLFGLLLSVVVILLLQDLVFALRHR